MLCNHNREQIYLRSGELDWLGVTLMVASAATYGWHLVLGQWVVADTPPNSVALYVLTTMAIVVGVARVAQSTSMEPITDQE